VYGYELLNTARCYLLRLRGIPPVPMYARKPLSADRASQYSVSKDYIVHPNYNYCPGGQYLTVDIQKDRGKMAAIEYGSYYWCVLLNRKDENEADESVHLHADEAAVDGTGCLIFKSAGRRAAGADPKQTKPNADKDSDKESKAEKDSAEDQKGSADKNADKNSGMIYVAFAPGNWKAFYAAKLQDGSPAAIEHWSIAGANRPAQVSVPDNAGAVGYSPRN